MRKKIQCPFCLEKFAIDIYEDDGNSQELIYDCEICCHPIEIQVSWDPDTEKFQVYTQKSTGF